MRRIEFRVWDVDEKEWYNNEKIPYQLIDNEGVFCWADDYEWNRYPGEVLITQYTGLKDKNGVKIYEGDIVKVNYNDAPEVKIITYHNASFGIRDNEMGFVPLAIFERPSKNLIVLGNIYENPELLGDNQ